jgi:hypothetical protein
MNPTALSYNLARRRFLTKASCGLGAFAFSSLLARDLDARPKSEVGPQRGTGLPSLPHFPPRARRVIYLNMSGGPSQLETFDPKPQLKDLHGQDLPRSVRGEQRITLMTRTQNKILVAAAQHHFLRRGQSGQEMNSLFQHLGKVADDLCIVRSMHTDPINHDPAMTFLQTGSPLAGRPCVGSWISYGLGTMNRDLPEFVVLLSKSGQPVPSRYWHNGFLPSRHQGVQFQSTGDPVLFLSNPDGIDGANRGRLVNGISRLNSLKREQIGDDEIDARINAYQLAYRMQTSVPELMDVSRESKKTLEEYGVEPGKASFGANCLLARRLAEAGVRFIQLYDRGWDHHGGVTNNITKKIREVDRPCAALLKDLKARGMLDDTLVIWGGEFGRTTYSQGSLGNNFGRDHHPRCFSIWMAGGGVQGGVNFGRTDDFAYNIAENPVSVYDLNATLLHLLGIDHELLTYRFQGRGFRLTDVEGKVRHELLA